MARKESDMKTYTKLAAVMLTSAMLSGCLLYTSDAADE